MINRSSPRFERSAQSQLTRLNKMKNGIIRTPLLFALIIVYASGALAAPVEDNKDKAAAAIAEDGADYRAVTYSCFFEGMVRDAATGAAIKGASVTFVKEDKSKSWTATTSD